MYVGLVGICDPPRPHVRKSITMLMTSGVKIKMVTGDARDTAAAIGNKLIKMYKKNFEFSKAFAC